MRSIQRSGQEGVPYIHEQIHIDVNRLAHSDASCGAAVGERFACSAGASRAVSLDALSSISVPGMQKISSCIVQSGIRNSPGSQML